jgi:hypothetical protein
MIMCRSDVMDVGDFSHHCCMMSISNVFVQMSVEGADDTDRDRGGSESAHMIAVCGR